jgi:nucleoside-diphosphate-sugar epimerase
VAFEHVALDLTDGAACRAAAGRVRGVTHVFWCGRAPRPTIAEEARVNADMLFNLMAGVEAGTDALRHVCLVHGTKWYGSQLGPYRTPAAEDDPRIPTPNFYYDQQDWTAERGARSGWRWTALRPHILAGFSLGYPHNAVGVIAAYATLARAAGRSLTFPGTEAAFDSVSQITDLRLLVEAMLWAMTDPAAADDSFNVVDADYYRWRDLGPRIADFFGMRPGGVATETLAETHREASATWRAIATRHGLSEPDLGRIASWGYGDFMFRIGWDDMSSTVKIRRAGFDPVYDSWQSFRDALIAYRARRVIP